MPELNRRKAIAAGTAGLLSPLARAHAALSQDPMPHESQEPREFLTPAQEFTDVSRGNPVPHSLSGQAAIDARLTPDSWRLEIEVEAPATLEKPRSLAADSALHYADLTALGRTHAVHFLKAMQCNNIALPLGQGLWTGVPLRAVLALCGELNNARRLYYWGFHNNDPKQIFRSSLAMNQVLDAPPGDLPPFLAYALNGEPIPLERGGPVRMVVPWAHGFKSVKWLQKIILTNHYEANDTYALANNDPESYLKTAAYFDSTDPESHRANAAFLIHGTAMVGWPGLARVEYWLRPATGAETNLPINHPDWADANWIPAEIDPPPAQWGNDFQGAPAPQAVWGFDNTGKLREWPMRFSIAHWTARIPPQKPGKYELRVRTVDRNGFAQPQPRPSQKSGQNLVACKLLQID